MHKTNVETVVNLMEFSRYGALAQVFVMDALSKHAKVVAEAPPESLASMKGGFISPEAWQGVAREIMGKLEKHIPTNKTDNFDASKVTKEEFLAMQAEIESIELSIAKGEETGGEQSRLRELEERMGESPWELDPDEGLIEKQASTHRP